MTEKNINISNDRHPAPDVGSQSICNDLFAIHYSTNHARKEITDPGIDPGITATNILRLSLLP